MLPVGLPARAQICVPRELLDLTTTNATKLIGFGRPVAVIGDRIVVGTSGQENSSPGMIHAGSISTQTMASVAMGLFRLTPAEERAKECDH